MRVGVCPRKLEPSHGDKRLEHRGANIKAMRDTIVVGHREDPGFGQLCDAVAFRQLVVVTGSGVSAELGNARSTGAPISTWHDVLKRLRNEFTDQLRGLDAHLDLLLNARPQNSEYLIEAATLIRGAVGYKPYRDAVVGLTTPREGAHSALHDLIEGLEPIGIITFNYDRGHENAYRSLRRRAPSLQRAIYSDEEKLRTILAGHARSRFLLKAHGCISRPHRSCSTAIHTATSWHANLVIARS